MESNEQSGQTSVLKKKISPVIAILIVSIFLTLISVGTYMWFKSVTNVYKKDNLGGILD